MHGSEALRSRECCCLRSSNALPFHSRSSMRLNIPRVTGKRIRHQLVAPAIVTIHFRIRFVRAEGGRASAITQFLNFAHLLCAQLEVKWFSAAVGFAVLALDSPGKDVNRVLPATPGRRTGRVNMLTQYQTGHMLLELEEMRLR